MGADITAGSVETDRQRFMMPVVSRAFCGVRKLSREVGVPKGRKIFTPGRLSIWAQFGLRGLREMRNSPHRATDRDKREEGGGRVGKADSGTSSNGESVFFALLIRCGPAFFLSSRSNGKKFFHKEHFLLT